MPLRSQARPIGRAKLRSADVAIDRAVSKTGSHTGAARALALGGLLHRIVYLGIALAVGYGLTRLLSEPRFQITNVEIQGARYLGPDLVLNTADVVGANLFRFSAREATRRLTALSVPEDVTVRLHLPNTATIVIDERPAVYLWKTGMSTFAVSDDGTVLGPPTTDHPSVLVTDADARTVDRGMKVDVRLLRAAAYIVRTMPSAAGFAPRSVDIAASQGASIISPDGITIIFGDDSNLAGKLAAAGPTLFAARQAQPAPTMIDLRFAGHPFYR